MRASMTLLALLLPSMAVAAAPEPVAPAAPSPLSRAWQGVVAQSPEYAAARARREAGTASSSAARALWMPSLGAEGGFGRRSLDTTSTGAQFSAPGFGVSNGVDFRTSVTDGNAHQWALVLQQPLLDAGRVADAEGLRARGRMAEAQFRLAEQALMVRTAEALAAVVEADARFKAVHHQHEAAQRTRDQAQARYESGDIPVTDWREAQAQLDALEVAELDARQGLAVATAAFTDLTGQPPPPANDIALTAPAAGIADATAAPTSEPAAEGTLSDWLHRAGETSPALAVQVEMLSQARAELRRWSRLDGFRLSLVGQYGRESLDGRGDFGAAQMTNRVASIGLQASVPLFTGGLRAAQRRAAESGERAAQADLDAARQQVALRTRTAWLEASSARARVRAQHRAGNSALLRLDATRVGFESGDRTLLDLLSAESGAMQAAADSVRARCQGLVATLRLAAAAGTLDAAALDAAGNGDFTCGRGD
ncbi:MAG: TolC family protein [Steroidobacteraceae bacterium]